jgi:hypothetical protein
MDEARAKRLALNESLFRDVNELIRKQQADHKDTRATFVCECIKVSCQLHLNLTVEEYERVRAHNARFVVYPGHNEPHVEAVIEDLSPRYMVIEKVDPGRAVAEETAPS